MVEKAEILEQIAKYENFNPSYTFKFRDKEIIFHIPSHLEIARTQTFVSKKFATFAWLNNIPEEGVLLDIGANVGLSALYAARIQNANVFAFEPESQNYTLLNKNIASNNLYNKIKAYCSGISDEDGLETLISANYRMGAADNTLSKETGSNNIWGNASFTQGVVSFSIDSLVEKGLIPLPDFVKINVNGLESNVLQGAKKTLSNPHVLSILIEFNNDHPKIPATIELLKEFGFEYSQAQVDKSISFDPGHTNKGEWIFYRKQDQQYAAHTVIPHVVHMDESSREFSSEIVNRIRKAEIIESPFPHVVVDNVFPEDYYAKILKYFPRKDQMDSIAHSGRTSGAYQDRFKTLFTTEDFARLSGEQKEFWSELGGWLYSPEFINGIIDMMFPFVEKRLNEVPKPLGSMRVSGDALLVNDQSNYAIGPHTDLPTRLITFLFYMPEDDRYKNLGTSIYEPDIPAFSCATGKHYKNTNFTLKKTIPFLPNRLLMFVRTDKSFHGVEKIIEENVERKLLINNIKLIDGS